MDNERLRDYYEFCKALWQYFKQYSAGITDYNAAAAINDGVTLLNQHSNVVRAEHIIVAVQTQLEHIGKQGG